MSLELILILIFVAGYLCIIFEHSIDVNKSATAVLTGILIWSVYILVSPDKHAVAGQLDHYIIGIAGILLFLLGAMTIVEIMDAHNGFDVIINLIRSRKKIILLWIIGWISFFLSAVLDNLTTSIVMVSLLRKLIPDSHKEDRMLFAGIVIIAANAGGAWTPIGDITTTMLWIGGQITTLPIMKGIFIPSVICLLVPLFACTFMMKGKFPAMEIMEKQNKTTHFEKTLVFFLGIGGLVFTPVFKTITHLPPFMGILFGLGVMWVVTELMHKSKEDEQRRQFSVQHALSKIDTASVLFFVGILTAIAGLESIGTLEKLAIGMDRLIGNQNIIVYCIGLLSAVIDNIPLVAATQGMYNISSYPVDSGLWHFIAYCAGTGGSILVIGSAAGVAVMGMEKINFIWYAKKIGWLAFLGYTAGAIAHLGLMHIGLA